MSSPFEGGRLLFSIGPPIIVMGFILVFGIIIFTLLKGVAQWNRNNQSPVLTVAANVVAKRIAVSRHHHAHSDNIAMNHDSSSTSYFATFEVESGDRIELRVPDKEYGMLVEGDVGKLTFQGTRYKGFERSKQQL